MNFKYFAAGVVATSLVAQPVAAQSVRDLHHDRTTDVRVFAGVTIPFGGKKRSADTKPRFDFGFEQRAQRNDTLLIRPWNADQALERRRMTLSLTLEDNPRILLNQQQVARFNLSTFADEADEAKKSKEDGGGNTLLIVGGAVLGSLLIATIATAADAADALNDLVEPD